MEIPSHQYFATGRFARSVEASVGQCDGGSQQMDSAAGIAGRIETA